jgi:hypothetical protein
MKHTGQPFGHIVTLLILVSALLLPCPAARAAIINVGCSVAELVNAINTANGAPAADTLELSAGCNYTLTAINNDDPNHGPNGLPVITTDITLNGYGATIGRSAAGGTPNFRIFQINNGGALHLKRLTVSNGYVNHLFGGGFYNLGWLSIANSTVSGHRSHGAGWYGGRGGAVYNDGGTVDVTNSVFSGNHAEQYGSGIYTNAGVLTVSGSTFTGHDVAFSGGAIMNWEGSATVSSSAFSGNRADTGGAIGSCCDFASLSVTSSAFAGNSAHGSGGAIKHNTGGILAVTGSTFSGNNSDLWAGAISNSSTKASVRNSTFSGNYAYESGGALSNSGALAVADSDFTGNYIDGSLSPCGGAISDSGALVTVMDSTFTDNSVVGAYGEGGAICADGSRLSVAGSTFSGNFANAGGAAIRANSTVDVANSTFHANTYNAIYVPGWRTVVVTNSTFSANSGTWGGAINNQAGSVTLKNTIIANSQGGTNCYNVTTDGGGNLRWPSTDSTCFGAFGDPKLGALADNGGHTRTMALGSGSAAIDAGSNAICAAAPVNNLDQRRYTRPADGDSNGSLVCDIGAYEAGAVSSVHLLFLPLVERQAQ